MVFPKTNKELDLIAKYFAPLSLSSKGALGLHDDAALMEVPSGYEAVVTNDILVEGIHFLANDPPETIAWKSLAVNLSDLASMGAKPTSYTLGFAIPSYVEHEWIKLYVSGLEEVQNNYKIALIGGDTVSTKGPITLSITAFGHVPKNTAILRSGASAGEEIYVTGSIGGGYLGLRYLQDNLIQVNGQLSSLFVQMYRKPVPRVGLGIALRGLATSATDISDGLIADLGNICRESDVSANIQAWDIPVPEGVDKLIEKNCIKLQDIFSGGDDYELLFTVPPGSKSKVRDLACIYDLNISQIGITSLGPANISFYDKNHSIIEFDSIGYSHF
jgi:thiamine-monophosphate kinase